MPSARTIRWAKIRVSITVIVALVILGVLMVLLTGGTLLEPKETLRTYMPDAAGLDLDSPVRLNGISIGKVSRIRFSGSRDLNRVIEVDLTAAHRYVQKIPADTVASIGSEDIQGDKYVDLALGRSAVPIRPGAEIPFQPAPDILKTLDLAQFDARLRLIDQLLQDIQEGHSPVSEFVMGDQLYRDTVSKVEAIHKAIQAATSTQQELGKLLYRDTLYQDILKPIRQLDDALARLERGEGDGGRLLRDPRPYEEWRKQIGGARRQLSNLSASPFMTSDDLYTQWNQRLAGLIRAVDDFNAGQGSMGPLAVDAQLYESLNGTFGQWRENLRDFREDPKKYLRLKLF